MARRRRRRGGGGHPSGQSSSSPNLFEQVAGGGLTFAGNLFDDVRDAVVGLPMGVVNLATDPVESIEAVGKSVWHTWSPLFAGDFGKFARQVYDHPLAPILDVASVFTLGAGTAARGASALSKAGSGGARAQKIAALRGPKEPLRLEDPDGKRHDVLWHPSPRAGRAALQQLRTGIEQHMPDWYVKPLQKFRYEKAWRRDMGGRVVAKSLVLSQVLEAGRRLSDEVSAPHERVKLLVGNHLQLIHHGIRVTPEEAIRLGAHERKGHYRFAQAIEFVKHDQYEKQIKRLRRKEMRWNAERERNAELANALPRIEKELEAANRRLAEMRTQGYRVAQPAITRRREPTEKQRIEQEAAPLVEQQRIIRDIEKRLEKARAAKTAHDEAVSRINLYRPQREALEQRSIESAYAHAGASPEAFEQAARNLARTATTRDINRAARTQDGKVVVVPRHDAYTLGLEMESSHKFVRWIYHRPTQLWKMVTIGYAPRAITNNTVGNWTLYAIREGFGPEAAQAVHDAISWQYGSRRASEIFDEAFQPNDLITREFGDVVGNVFSAELRSDLDTMGKLSNRAQQGLYPIVHTLADKPVRVASLYAFFRRLDDVKAELKKGADIDTAIKRALRQKPWLRDAAVGHVNRTAGDYAGLLTAEKHIRQLVPFYLWYRHIVRTTGNIVLDTPARAAVMQRLSALGIESTEELLGEIPEFLEGAVPLSALGFGDGSKSGRKDVLLTQSLNPFASVAEISALVEAFTTGTGERGNAAAAMGLNPLLTAAAEATFGRRLLTGGPTDTFGGIIPTVGKQTIEGLPQVRAVRALLEEDTAVNPSGSEKLFTADDRSPLTSLFGVPIRSVGQEAAERLANAEGGGSSGGGRRRRRRRR